MGSGHFPSASQQSPLVPLTEEGLARLSPLVLAAGPKLDSREYELMLDPAKFADEPQRSVDRLWDRVLKDVIATRLDRRKNGEPRHKKKFEPDHERLVVFRDTEGCLLNANGYLLRERSRLNGDQRELTLIFRTPDIFLAAQSWIGGTAGDDLEFEEDIAPLIRRTTTASGQEKVAFARPPTMRSYVFAVGHRADQIGPRHPLAQGRHRLDCRS